MYEQLFNILLV